jgi:hypothetical protein
LFYRFPRFFFEVGLRNPILSRALMQMIDDRIGYGGLFLQILGTFPLFLVTKKNTLNTQKPESRSCIE